MEDETQEGADDTTALTNMRIIAAKTSAADHDLWIRASLGGSGIGVNGFYACGSWFGGAPARAPTSIGTST